MQTRSRSILHVFMLLALLAILFGMFPASPVQPVQAQSLTRPLQASGDFMWAKRMGRTLNDQGNSIAVDSSGNVYTTGTYNDVAAFNSSGTCADFVNSCLTSAGGNDIFVSKVDSSGNFLWAKSMGGTGNDFGRGIAVDSNGNVYTTGYFSGTADFDPSTFGTDNWTSWGGNDVFVSKLDTNGKFLWARHMGGGSDDAGLGIALDSSGNIYVAGDYTGTAFSLPSPFNLLPQMGGLDIFVSKLDNNGNFTWTKGMGGASDEVGLSIAVDSSGNVYTTSYYTGTADFTPSSSFAYNLTSAGAPDIFISKFDTNGNFIWAKSMGGTGWDFGYGIALDPGSGEIYITGDYNDIANFDPGICTIIMTNCMLTSAGGFDIFVSKFDTNGNLLWAKSMGGAGVDYGYGIVVEPGGGNVYITGNFSNTADLNPATFGTANLTSAGGYDIFVSKLTKNGNYVWAKSFSGLVDDYGMGIALDPIGNIFTTGSFASATDFDPSAANYYLYTAADTDIFVSKLQNDLAAPTVSSIVRVNANPTSAASVDFTVTFSESVTGVDASDFNLTTSGVSGAAVSGVSGSGSVYTVSVNTGSGIGTIRLDLVDNGSIQDGALNPLGANFTSGETYKVRTTTFADVPTSYWAWQYIERLYSAGITGGCSITPLNYCPDATVTRAQMAVFLLKGIHGSSYTPPAVGVSSGFTDVATDYWAAAWIKQLAAEGITSGCGAGIYCPDTMVTRAQMAVFLLKAKHGPSYSPPFFPSSIFSDTPTLPLILS